MQRISIFDNDNDNDFEFEFDFVLVFDVEFEPNTRAIALDS